MVLKELIFNNFHAGWDGGIERADFYQFLLWKGEMVLKEMIFIIFYFGRV